MTDHEPAPGLPPPYVPTGLAVGIDGTIYKTAYSTSALYRSPPPS